MAQEIRAEREWDAWGEDLLLPVRSEVRAHPWMGVAAGLAAGALIGALTRGSGGEELMRLRVDRRSRVVVRLPPPEAQVEEEVVEVEEPAEEGPGLLERTGTRLGGLARGAGASLRQGADRLVESLPRRKPPSRMDRLRRAVSGALPRRKRGLAERVRGAFR